MERTSGNVVISGFEYTYDDLSRIAEERILAGAVKVCYTCDALSRVTDRMVRRLSDNSVVSSESFTYDAAGNVTGASGSTFAYDTYGKLLSRTGTSAILFGFNGRDGVITDTNGLIYMRARYYSPDMKRFINADISWRSYSCIMACYFDLITLRF